MTKVSDPKALLKADFRELRNRIERGLLEAESPPDLSSWQSTKAPAPMPELFNFSFSLDLRGVRDLDAYREAFEPNLPWADEHFLRERISGRPKNPGTTWRQWPYAASAARHRVGGEEQEDPPFDHSYAERYWPRHAGKTKGGDFDPRNLDDLGPARRGIRSEYGDLSHLVYLLLKDPSTRQAYLPVWFPEDLFGAAEEGRRVPCTLGYHFIRRGRLFHCVYPMRSCDYVRHFADDVYLTVRLQLAILGMLASKDPDIWSSVIPGSFTMHITSLHLFESDRDAIKSKWGVA